MGGGAKPKQAETITRRQVDRALAQYESIAAKYQTNMEPLQRLLEQNQAVQSEQHAISVQNMVQQQNFMRQLQAEQRQELARQERLSANATAQGLSQLSKERTLSERQDARSRADLDKGLRSMRYQRRETLSEILRSRR